MEPVESSIRIVQVALALLAAYGAIGLVVGVPFVARSVQRIDRGAAHAPWTFRLLILPGVVLLWPVVVFWMRRTAHGSRAP